MTRGFVALPTHIILEPFSPEDSLMLLDLP